ncbi:MAG: hypothetical protein LBD03_04100 [Methanobrevibacter sp.]|nr:hypothetical protein [Candidatus Methanovirga procula]
MVIYTDFDPVCPKCGLHITAKYGKGDRLINKNYPVKVTIYRCKCGGFIQNTTKPNSQINCNLHTMLKRWG